MFTSSEQTWCSFMRNEEYSTIPNQSDIDDDEDPKTSENTTMSVKWMQFSAWKAIAIPLFCEFVSQYFHTFWGVMTTGPYVDYINCTESSDWKHCEIPGYFERVFVPAFQSGLSAWMQVVLFWKISGVHFNPSVSLAFLVTGKLKVTMFFAYVLFQCIGSVAAAFIAKEILEDAPSVIVVPEEANMLVVFLNEVTITFIHVFFALPMTLDGSYDQPTGPLAIGLSVFQGSLTAQWVGVACISPSRAFGPAVITGGAAWNRHWLLWVSDLSGGACAAMFYMTIFAPKNTRWGWKWFTKQADETIEDDDSLLSEQEKKEKESTV